MSIANSTIPEESDNGEIRFKMPESSDFLSKWDDGVAIIESILEPGSASYEAMTEKQRIGLENVKKLLLDGVQVEDHIPNDLIRLRDEAAGGEGASDGTRYLLTEFGGVPEMTAKQKVKKVVLANIFIRALSARKLAIPRLSTAKPVCTSDYAPSEWNNLTPSAKIRIYDEFLSWEALSKWDFNVFEMVNLCSNRPLLFIGWAVLASPESQIAMAKSIGKDTSIPIDFEGYNFLKIFNIKAKALCDFLRIIENDYNHKNPYHNNVHAADVVQSLHSMLTMKPVTLPTTDIELFCVLLAAVVHDVGHPGYNNAFQIHAQTELALLYNDISVLESMHASKAFRRIFSGKTTGDYRGNFLRDLSPRQIESIRKMTIEAVLHTDMSKHFSFLNSIKGLIRTSARAAYQRRGSMESSPESDLSAFKDSSHHASAVEDGDACSWISKMGAGCGIPIRPDSSWKFLTFMLHLADISNPAKPGPMFTNWTDRCLEEFFAQGDKEQEMGLDISPLCDRATTKRPDSQIGFINFIVKPSFAVLAQVIPELNDSIVPVIESNAKYWEKEKTKPEPEEDVPQQPQKRQSRVSARLSIVGRLSKLG